MKAKKLKKSKRLTRVYKTLECQCSACKSPEKKLPHPVEFCTCSRCQDVMENFKRINPNNLCFSPYTTSNTKTIELNKLPIDGEDYINEVIYWEVYEQYPGPKGDVIRSICVRDRKEDADRILNVLEATDISWSCYGIRKIVEPRNKPVVKSIWTRISEWLNSASPI